jgi:hypothetical protein
MTVVTVVYMLIVQRRNYGILIALMMFGLVIYRMSLPLPYCGASLLITCTSRGNGICICQKIKRRSTFVPSRQSSSFEVLETRYRSNTGRPH